MLQNSLFEQNKVLPIQSLKYNFPNLLEIFHYEMYKVHLNFQKVHHLFLGARAEQVMITLQTPFDLCNPEKIRNKIKQLVKELKFYY